MRRRTFIKERMLFPLVLIMVMAALSVTFVSCMPELPTEDELKELHGFAKEFDLRETEGFRIKSAINYDFWQGHLKSVIDFATNYELEDFKKSEQESLDYVRQFVRAGATISISNAELDTMLAEARTYVQNSNRIKKKDDYFKSFDEIKRTSWKKSVAWKALPLSSCR